MRSSRRTPATLALMMVAGLLVATAAEADHGPDPYISVEQDLTITPSSGPIQWQGTTATGANVDYDFDSGEPCFDPRDPLSDPSQRRYCDIALLHVDLAGDEDHWASHGGGVQVSLSQYTNPTDDFDFQIFASDADGTKGALVGGSGNPPGADERFTVPSAQGYYLIQVVYFATVEASYTGQVLFVSRPDVAPDVDVPPGLQESLASDPANGFRSHSEPHVAQSPQNPDVLVAGSKMYNRDPDSLAEYEFKVGTYVSFDRGRSWTDLGQTAVCPAQQAGPDTWPNNSCYPEENPDTDGTGPEDEGRGGGGDFAEEYITSDPWLHFDDEGNAYLMVLDAPPFESGRGWGMTLHKWDSVSPEDLVTGDTWSDRIVINHYDSDLGQKLFLDDKNTFAVNNAGPDGDGESGTMIACWGQNIPDLVKQQIVCERSTDGGESWPDKALPISGAFPLVIGAHVVADPNDPKRFSAVWLQYASGIVGPSTLEFAQTLDGGVTWTPPATVVTFQAIPRRFPGQSFRNLSLPIMAAGPGGDLNIVYAAYHPTDDPADEDGMQADVMLVRSDLMGLPGSWSEPVTVNGDSGRADQFQPSVAVGPAGQIEVTYFDRRHDPSNYFIDTYLSRMTVGESGAVEGRHDLRLSHDPWDPSVNPPISTSGDFIGDYQGLVADGCFTIPFVNDTHLANDPARDPDFDDGLPRSEFQEVFSWLVPNTPEFGGSGAGCDADPETTHASGGGQAPGKDGGGTATFGLNVRGTSGAASGTIRVSDHGSGQHIRTVSIDAVTRSGSEALIRATCRVDAGPARPCEFTVVDNAEPGAGADEFRVRVGSDYSGGGTLVRGDVKVR